MAQVPGAEAFVRMLQLHGVNHVFGLCGDTSLPLYDALYRLDHGIRHVLTRDERSAAYMADGYARVSGRVGVCEGPSGGGATYILPGVVEANESSIPVLCFTSDISVSARGRFALTELDQAALFRPLTKWNAVLDAAADIPRTLRRAFSELATGRPGAVHIGLPYDVQRQPVDDAELWADASLGEYPARRSVADAAAVAEAARLLAAAARPLFIVGGGAVIAGAEPELAACAEALGAPVATTISGKGSIAEDHPLAVGVVGSNGGTLPTRAVVAQADLVVFVGCRAGSVTTERWRFPAPGKVTVIHLDVDPRVIGANYPTAAALIGDAKLTLAALRDALARQRGGWGRDAAAQAKAEKLAAFEPLARSDERPIRPERVVATLNAVLPDDAIVVADPGTPCPYLSAYYRVRAHRPPLLLESRARRARLLDGRRGRRALRASGREGGCGHGRRQLRHDRGRARDDRPPPRPGRDGRDLERDLRLDQGRAEDGIRRALFLGRFRRDRSRRGGVGVRGEELARGRSGEAARNARGGDRAGCARARRRRLPAAPGGAGPRQRVDSLSSTNRRSRPRTVRNTSVSSTQ